MLYHLRSLQQPSVPFGLLLEIVGAIAGRVTYLRLACFGQAFSMTLHDKQRPQLHQHLLHVLGRFELLASVIMLARKLPSLCQGARALLSLFHGAHNVETIFFSGVFSHGEQILAV